MCKRSKLLVQLDDERLQESLAQAEANLSNGQA